MQIQSGKLYENRTWKYLFPCLKYYGNDLINYLTSFIKLGVGIGDDNVKTEGNCIFILIETNVPLASELDRNSYKRSFSKFLDWLRYQPYYMTDYVYEGLDSGEKHMVVIKVPPIHDTTYVNFIQGNYSEMYKKEELNKYFNIMNNDANNLHVTARNERVHNSRLVLTKDSKYAPTFVNQINKEYGSNATLEDFKDAELDYPIKLTEEIF